MASGDILSEIAARFAITREVFRPLRAKLFKRTSIAVQDKVHIAGSILLSRQFNGSGTWPDLKTTERQRLHRNVLGMVRGALTEQHGDNDQMLSDSDIISVYELRAPYAQVRFSRLRLSIRIINQAHLGLLVMLYGARSDSRSWLAALASDIKWMLACDPSLTLCMST